MKINLSPARGDETLTLSVEGNVVILNGEAYDLGFLNEGESISHEVFGSKWLTDKVSMIDGQLELSVILPYGPGAPESTRYPSPIVVLTDGPVDLPAYTIAD